MSREELASFAAKMLARHAVASFREAEWKQRHWSDFLRLDMTEIRKILERADTVHCLILRREASLQWY